MEQSIAEIQNLNAWQGRGLTVDHDYKIKDSGLYSETFGRSAGLLLEKKC